ncbi:MAG TPA: twin-arginine translocase subunit TatC [Acidimicrobiales bacterium]|nr:twin-arginine translocase subunit TatC [Acidimicrobiales bacterium]
MALRLHRHSAPRPSPQAMTVVEHLGELRRRVVISIAAVAVGGAVAFALYSHILSFFVHPYCQVVGPHHPCQLFVTGPLDGLSIRLKIAGYGGLFIASPVVLWQLWRFVTPGLQANEKRYAIPFIVASIVLFAVGASLAYLTFPHALSFLIAVGGPSLQQIYSPTSYLSLIVLLMAAFGATFEFPVLLVCLELAGVLTPAKLAAWRRRAIVVLVAAAAVITPSSDPFSMLVLAIPMCLFYEAAILIGRLMRR